MSDLARIIPPEEVFREVILPYNKEFLVKLGNSSAGADGIKNLFVRFNDKGIFKSRDDNEVYRSASILVEKDKVVSVVFSNSKLTGPFDEGLSVVEARVLKSINGFKPLDMDRLKVFREGNGVKKFELVNSMAAFKKDLGNFNTVINL